VEGVAAPSTRTPLPLSAFGLGPNEKVLGASLACYMPQKKAKAGELDIAPLNVAQKRFTTLEVAADWHWL